MQRNNRLIVALGPGVVLYSAPRKIEDGYYMLTVSTAGPEGSMTAPVADPVSLVVRGRFSAFCRRACVSGAGAQPGVLRCCCPPPPVCMTFFHA